MKIFFTGLIFFVVFQFQTEAITTTEFKQILIKHLETEFDRNVPRFERMYERAAAPGRGLTYDYWAMCIMHKHTGEQKYLDWALDGFTHYVRYYRDRDGSLGIGGHRRNLTKLCWVYDYLKDAGLLSQEDMAATLIQIEASMEKAKKAADHGGHNRAIIDACAAMASSLSFPEHPDAESWKRRAHSLSYDALYKWSIEDASIYQPFWWWYMVKMGEMKGISDSLMGSITTRYYPEYFYRLQMPNGMIPDFGDGDATQMWEWFMADLVLAGSYYKKGEYLYSAFNAYNFAVNTPGSQPANPAVIASAIDWIDTEIEMIKKMPTESQEAVEELIGKKIVFRNENDSYMLLNYRDLGNFGHFQREYLNIALEAFEEKQHHGHSDENSVICLYDNDTILLHDGGYRREALDGWRSDLYHNRIVARKGWPVDFEQSDHSILGLLKQNKTYNPDVETKKIHFAPFAQVDYSRTRLIDKANGYTGDRIILYFKEPGYYVIVDSILIDEDGPISFVNMWHPSNILTKGSFEDEKEHYVISLPEKIPNREKYIQNNRNSELLIQFIDNRDKITDTQVIDRAFNDSDCFYQWVKGWFYKGMRINFITVLRPHKSGSFDESMLQDITIENDERLSGGYITVNAKIGNSNTISVGLKLDSNIGRTNLRGRPLLDWKTGSIDYGSIKSDADFVYVCDDGKQIEYALINASIVEYNGQNLFEMPIQNPDTMWQGASVGYTVPDVRDRMPIYTDILEK
jgi:hypothetical protein